MLSAKWVRENIDRVRGSLLTRQVETNLDSFLQWDRQRRECISQVDELKNEQNQASRQIRKLKAAGEDASSVIREMQEVAERIGMDVSTVSRAVSGKYIDTPVGVYPLRMFFSSGFRRSGPLIEGQPSALSRVAVKDLIAEIIENEDKSKPLSDDEVARELAGRGINVKRRTVNKYRAELGIPSKEKRSQY